MNKKIVAAALCVVLALCGCSDLKKAQKAYDDGDYKQVVSMLEGSVNEKTKGLYDSAKYKLYESDIKAAVDNRDSAQLAQTAADLEKYFSSSTSAAELESYIIERLSDIIKNEPKYEDFTYIEDVKTKLDGQENSKNLVSSLKKLISDHSTDKLKAALSGKWTRKETGFLDGAKIEVMFSSNTGKAVLSYAPVNRFGFANGDIKWKDIEIFSDTNFSFNDLHKGLFSYGYTPANATIDYGTMTVSVHNSDDGEGVNQTWVKDQYSSTAQQNTQENVQGGDYLFPSDTQYITNEYLSTLTKDQVALVRNEIYARHGYVFKTESIQNYFAAKSWYTPNPSFDESQFSEIEKANKDKIVEYEKQMGWR